MPRVNLEIHGRGYELACDTGQEEHLRELAAYIDRRMRELSATIGDVGEMRLLVMTSLLIADELSDSLAREGLQLGEETPEEQSSPVRSLEWAADRIEAIAARLEAS